jgi:hypothetical protein
MIRYQEPHLLFLELAIHLNELCNNQYMLKRLSSIVFVAIITLYGKGQPPQTQAFLPKVIQSSPEAAGIAKFGNYDVNLFTGIPNISIPIYTVQIGELTVPISLNYHASGIKVNEIPSWAGLGWSLSTGGSITRKMMGKADEYDGNYLRPSSNGSVKYTSEINTSTQAGLDYLRFINQNSYDVEPDIFSYSLPSKSGKFLFNQRDNYNPIIMPFDPIKITKTFPTSATMLLDITDESGILYKFGTYEWTNTSSGAVVTDAISTWLMSEMISSNKQDTINFTYTPRSGSGNTDSYFSDYIVLNDQVVNYASPGYTPDFGTSYTSSSSVTTTWQTPNQILFKNGKVVFEQASEDREDFWPSGHVIKKRIKFIKVYNYDKLSNTYRLIQTIQFFHSYFIVGSDASTKRLRLDSLTISGGGGTKIQTYRFEYNASQLLPTKLSRSVDYWGYYNNANNNTLVPRMEVPYYDNGSSTITIGSNITNGRDPNPSYMQANVLKKIFYPTGGYSEFEFETNQYLDGSTPKYAGGLRIKKIKNYDGINAVPIIKTYKYGTNESGYGRANFILNNYFFQSSQTNRYFFQESVPGQCYLCPCLNATKQVRTFFSNPTIDIEPYDGSPVVYPFVAEYIGDETNNIGKTIFQFNDHADGMNVVTGFGRPIITSYHFDRGQVINKDVYKKTGASSYAKVATTSNSYSAFSEQWNSALGLVVFKWRINQGNWTGDDINAGPEASGCFGDDYSYLFANYSIRSDDNKITQTVETIYNENDQNKTLVTTTNYYYDNTDHQQITRIQKTNSKGQTILNTLKYPQDAPYSSSAPYTDMVNNHIIDKVIEDKQTNSGNQLSHLINNYYNWSNNNYLPQTIQLQVGSNTIETRANFLKYDVRGNVQELQKSNDVKLSYIWDYQKIYPIAEVMGANESDIAYTSFESDGRGNWSFSGLQFTDGSAPTGKKAYNLSTGNITKTSLSTSTTYYISYWSKNGLQTVSGTSVTTTGRSINGWTQYEHKVINPSGGAITVSGNGIIDELRLYPDKSFMTTTTYEPLIGITSQCDANHKIVYYEYDDINRLMLIRDQDKNVLKKICYNYHGETENCTIYYNSAQNGNFTRNNCSPGYTGSSVTYIVPANTYSSTINQTDANNKAIADRDANGQAYANALGTCTAPMVTINGYNTKSSTYQVKFTNNATGNWYTFYLNPNTYSPYYLGQVPAGTYTVQFYPAGSPVSATHNINGYTQYGGYGATFYNISITTTSQASMY